MYALRIGEFRDTNSPKKPAKKNCVPIILIAKAMKNKGFEKPEETFEKAFENVMPRIEVRPKRVGGSIYQVPQEVKPKRQFALAVRWILASARAKKGGEFSTFLAQELIEVIPDAVVISEKHGYSDFHGVASKELVGHLLCSIQHMNKKFEELSNKYDDLKAKYDAIQ